MKGYEFKRVWAIANDEWVICEIGYRKFTVVSINEAEDTLPVWSVPPYLCGQAQYWDVKPIDENELSDMQLHFVIQQIENAEFLDLRPDEAVDDETWEEYCDDLEAAREEWEDSMITS